MYLESGRERTEPPRKLAGLYSLNHRYGTNDVLYWFRQADYPDSSIWDPSHWDLMAEWSQYYFLHPEVLVTEYGNQVLAAFIHDDRGRTNQAFPLLTLTHPNGQKVPAEIANTALNIWAAYGIFDEYQLQEAVHVLSQVYGYNNTQRHRGVAERTKIKAQQLFLLGLIGFASFVGWDMIPNQTKDKLLDLMPGKAQLDSLTINAEEGDVWVDYQQAIEEQPGMMDIPDWFKEEVRHLTPQVLALAKEQNIPPESYFVGWLKEAGGKRVNPDNGECLFGFWALNNEHVARTGQPLCPAGPVSDEELIEQFRQFGNVFRAHGERGNVRLSLSSTMEELGTSYMYYNGNINCNQGAFSSWQQHPYVMNGFNRDMYGMLARDGRGGCVPLQVIGAIPAHYRVGQVIREIIVGQ